MGQVDTWKQLKHWKNLLRKLEEGQRKQIIERLERQIPEKQKELEKKRLKHADEQYKRNQDIEKLEKLLREKREEIEKEKVKHFYSDNNQDHQV